MERIPETSIPLRYQEIDKANHESFYMTDPNRPFSVITSVYSTGGDTAAKAARKILGGNMSVLNNYGPSDILPEDRPADAEKNMLNIFQAHGIDPSNVRILLPDRDYSTPLKAINLDNIEVSEKSALPITSAERGDFIYTRNPNIHLAARPADCPIMIASAETLEGPIHMLVHFAWLGAANHYVQQTGDLFDELGVDRSTLRIYLTPGAQAESYKYTNYAEDPLVKFPGTEGLFKDASPTETADGTRWDFGIDTPSFVYNEILKFDGVDKYQVFCDTSDTGSDASGYSSHGRSSRNGWDNTRDIIFSIKN